MAKQRPCPVIECHESIVAIHDAEFPSKINDHLQAEHGMSMQEYISDIREQRDDLADDIAEMQATLDKFDARISRIEYEAKQYGLME